MLYTDGIALRMHIRLQPSPSSLSSSARSAQSSSPSSTVAFVAQAFGSHSGYSLSEHVNLWEKMTVRGASASTEHVQQTQALDQSANHAPRPNEPRLERLLEEARASTSQTQQRLLQELDTLGALPNRYKLPANRAKISSNN